MNQTDFPNHTPWGAPQSTHVIDEGIVRYSTASHGGYWLSASRIAEMPDGLRPTAHLDGDGGAWFEEDLESAIVTLAFPHHFDSEAQVSARKLVIDWMPEIWEAWTGERLSPEASYTRRRDAFLEQHRNEQLVLSAVGSWDKRVPEGVVGLIATLGGRSPCGEHAGTETYWLVPEREYHDAFETPGHMGYFIIDQARHQPWSRDVDSVGA